MRGARRLGSAVAAVAVAVGILMSPMASTPSHAAANSAGSGRIETAVNYTKILVSDDGKLVMVCRYTSSGRLLYCDVNPR